mmetsp:Transcript_17971/g.49890  ORF Transcript_17971/g.49890 Transcript_17971/m.49890 type:complete len:284 (+) Transcript_17971:814-1665(+)
MIKVQFRKAVDGHCQGLLTEQVSLRTSAAHPRNERQRPHVSPIHPSHGSNEVAQLQWVHGPHQLGQGHGDHSPKRGLVNIEVSDRIRCQGNMPSSPLVLMITDRIQQQLEVVDALILQFFMCIHQHHNLQRSEVVDMPQNERGQHIQHLHVAVLDPRKGKEYHSHVAGTHQSAGHQHPLCEAGPDLFAAHSLPGATPHPLCQKPSIMAAAAAASTRRLAIFGLKPFVGVRVVFQDVSRGVCIIDSRGTRQPSQGCLRRPLSPSNRSRGGRRECSLLRPESTPR